MSKLSIIIPARDERFLTPTIDDIFRNARGEIEVVAVLDSDTWPGDWKEVTARHPRLHTIHNGSPKGMRHSINVGVNSAISRRATYIAKFDGHCSFGEGFDEILKAECEPDWIVVPRRLRLEPESWTIAEPDKPPHDYHYLSFPDNPDDFGGAGLNGRPWVERTKERLNKPEYLLDEEMSSQGSGWFMHAAYFNRLELMDEASYGPFWNEFQELGLKCWLSGGRVIVNKRTHYAHLHKGKKYGRGYKLDERWLTMGRNHTMLWPWNEAWDKQTKPFEWLIDHFWPVPTWPENWRDVLYATRRPKSVVGGVDNHAGAGVNDSSGNVHSMDGGLRIIQAHYGIGGVDDLDVRALLQSLVINDSLDIIVNNSTLALPPNHDPFRGKKKQLNLTYSYGDGEVVTVTRQEKEALIVGQPQRIPATIQPELPPAQSGDVTNVGPVIDGQVQLTASALNDFLLRRFSISPYRLRAPMPIELPNFHRNDLAQLFAELGFRRGAEIGVAEGSYSEVLLKANPDCELLLVDPWHAYSDNPQNKSKEKHEFAFDEVIRKTTGYPNVTIVQDYSMNAVRAIGENTLDWVYVDANHLFDHCVMDLIEWSKRVRSGGIVSGDDYYQLDQKRWVGGGVVEAVQAYVNAHRIPIWYIFQGHKSVDFMFVKP